MGGLRGHLIQSILGNSLEEVIDVWKSRVQVKGGSFQVKKIEYIKRAFNCAGSKATNLLAALGPVLTLQVFPWPTGNLCRCTGYRPILRASDLCQGKWGLWDSSGPAPEAATLWNHSWEHYKASGLQEKIR